MSRPWACSLKAILRNRKSHTSRSSTASTHLRSLPASAATETSSSISTSSLPGLEKRLVLETELRRAERALGEDRRNERRRERR